MRKIIIFGILALILIPFAISVTLKTTFNPFTGKLDYYNDDLNLSQLQNSTSSFTLVNYSSEYASTGYKLVNFTSNLNTQNASLWNRSGTNTILRFTGDNVGIGTTGPTVKLDVVGKIIATSDNDGISLQHATAGTTTALYLDFKNSAGAEIAYLGYGGGNTNVQFYNGLNGEMSFWTNALQRMTILGNGNVGIGTTTPTHTFNVVGAANFSTQVFMTSLTGASGSPDALCHSTTTGEVLDNPTTTCLVSSIRFKTNITPLRLNSCEILDKLEVKEFNYINGGIHFIYFIAEDVEKIEPKLIAYDKEGKPHSIHNEEITALTIDCMQKMRGEIDELKRKIEAHS